MKVFDLHTDILYDVYTYALAGDLERFTDYHLPQLKESIVTGGIWTLYSPDKFDLLEAVKLALSALPENALSLFSVVLGFEGLVNLKNYEDIVLFYNMGFRHASLTWNEENAYATGVAGNPDRGLTAEGRKLIEKMDELGMIIDLAHLNEKSFFDILHTGRKNIIFSHGNIKSLRNHRRNLSDDQLAALKEAGGLLGLTAAGSFVAEKKEERTADNFLNHVDKAVAIMGIDNVGFGFDFMDYFTEDFPDSNLRDVPDVTHVSLIVNGMGRRGYSKEEINKICYDNFYKRYKTKLYKELIK